MADSERNILRSLSVIKPNRCILKPVRILQIVLSDGGNLSSICLTEEVLCHRVSPRSFPAEENSLLSSSLGGNRRPLSSEEGRREGKREEAAMAFVTAGGERERERRRRVVVNVIGSGRRPKEIQVDAKKNLKEINIYNDRMESQI